MQETVAVNYLPALRIHNSGSTPLSGLTLRIVLPGKQEARYAIEQTIAPNEDITLDLIEYELDWQKEFRLEVTDQNGRYAFIAPDTDIVDICTPTFPPILACWENGFWGGMVLKIGSVEGTLTNVQLHKADGSTSTPCELKENGDLAKIGWCEMSDSNGPVANTYYVLTCNEADPVLCCLYNQENISDAGWKTAAKWALGLGASVVLGS
jgi:hypothetical protein